MHLVFQMLILIAHALRHYPPLLTNLAWCASCSCWLFSFYSILTLSSKCSFTLTSSASLWISYLCFSYSRLYSLSSISLSSIWLSTTLCSVSFLSYNWPILCYMSRLCSCRRCFSVYNFSYSVWQSVISVRRLCSTSWYSLCALSIYFYSFDFSFLSSRNLSRISSLYFRIVSSSSRSLALSASFCSPIYLRSVSFNKSFSFNKACVACFSFSKADSSPLFCSFFVISLRSSSSITLP